MTTSVVNVWVGGTGDPWHPISMDIECDGESTPGWSGTLVFNAADPFLPGVIDARSTPYPRARIEWLYDGAPVLQAFLLIRAVVQDDLAGTVTMTVKSAEVLVQDYHNATTGGGAGGGGADYSPGIMTQLAMWNFAMGKLTPQGIVTTASTGLSSSVSIPAQGTVWKNGQDLDSWLRGALRISNFDIMQDMGLSYSTDGLTDTLYLKPASLAGTIPLKRGTNTGAGSAKVEYGVNLLASRWGTTVEPGDGSEWAEALIADYNWVTSAGVSNRKSYAKYTLAAHRKGLHLSFDTGDPGADPTASMLAVANAGGYSAFVQSLPTQQYNLSGPFLAMPVAIGCQLYVRRPDPTGAGTPGGDWWKGTVGRIHWSFPDDSVEYGLKNPQPSGTPPL